MRSVSPKILALIVSAVSAAAVGAEGSFCVAPVPKATSGTKSLANATASRLPYEFKITVGDLASIATSHTDSIFIGGLDASKSHLVVIHQGTKPVASFKVHFKNRKSKDLCLWFGPLYESWSVWPMAESRGKCTCAAGMSSNTSLERTREG
jgi:hypothetical protein